LRLSTLSAPNTCAQREPGGAATAYEAVKRAHYAPEMALLMRRARPAVPADDMRPAVFRLPPKVKSSICQLTLCSDATHRSPPDRNSDLCMGRFSQDTQTGKNISEKENTKYNTKTYQKGTAAHLETL
jgi:hypothetical protein